MAKTITLSDVNKKRLRIASYLIVSGVLGYGISVLSSNPQLQLVFGGAINFILYCVVEELKKEGYVAAFKKEE